LRITAWTDTRRARDTPELTVLQHGVRMSDDETLVSVDIEASGPTPTTGSLISIGACLVDDPATAFYALLKPIPELPWLERTERIHGLTRADVERDGQDPAAAMSAFANWLSSVTEGRQSVFVGWNAGFDWMFVADYFERFIGSNPFGIAPLDMKAYAMGKHRLARWADTRRQALDGRYGAAQPLTHNALDDARQQAEFISRLLGQDDQDG
jgi:DNA polymerase III epsilon subunit-like protein